MVSVKWLKEMASPFTISYTFVKKYAEGNYGGILIAVILVTAALGGLGYYAFVHRRSERTGMAFVFPWIGTVVKFLIVVPGGLGSDLFSICCQVTVPERSGGFLD